MLSVLKRVFTVVIAITGCIGMAMADERAMSLKEALATALKDNPELRAKNLGLLSAGEEVNIARSFLLPKITFEERFMRTNTPTYTFMAKLNQERFAMRDFIIDRLNNPDPTTDFQTSISFEQALFVPKAYYGIKMARLEFDAKKADFLRKREETVFSVFTTYLDIQTAEAYVSAAEKGIEDANEHLRIAESRYKAGLGLYSDMLRAQVAVKTAEERKISAEKNLLVAKRALGLMLGLTEPISAQDRQYGIEPKDINYYSSAALQRSDLKAMQMRRDNAENSLKMAGSAYFPVIGFGGSYQMNSHRAAFKDEGSSYQVMAFLRWELFDGLKRESEKRKAKYQMQEADEYLNGLKKQIAFEIYETYLSVEEVRKGLELAKANLAAAEEGRRLVKARFENSLSAIVDMLDVQAGLDAARADTVAKEAAYYKSIARLSFMSGTILKDLEIE